LDAASRELHALHREMLIASGEAHGHVRTSVSNLVAACTEPDQASRAAAALLRIGAVHPARAIVILARPDDAKRMEADVSLHGGDASQPTIELVRLEVGGEPSYHLTGIVAPLLIPDMPVYLWVLGAPPLRQAFSADTVELTERIIVDSGAYDDSAATLALIAGEQHRFGDGLHLADLAWERTAPWREMTAQAFDPVGSRPFLRDITTLTVRCAGERASTEAWLLAGWMASRLSWPASGWPRVDVAADGAQAEDDAGALIEVRVEAARDGRTATVHGRRGGDCLHTSVAIEDAASQRTVSLRQQDDATLISRLMADATDASIYAAAVASAVDLSRRAA
ncbi:MAG: glucose-6-phosphate dehydrogenase assembly protein OpcA, partial [Candidatus Dormibacteraeota bacterium]|nr:glucose-6-phosphate dehydrogenase assembly protein OpcA [Candidatus Dormibacteraeota bacterium]